MIENPVKSPIVPPIAESLSTSFADLSLLITSNVGVLNSIFTYFKLFLYSNSKMKQAERLKSRERRPEVDRLDG